MKIPSRIGFEKEFFEPEDLHQMETLGLSVTPDQGRPVLLLKSLVNAQILPVGLSAMEAGVTLGQAPSNRLQMSPHHLLQSILTSFGVQIERAVFCEIKGPHQFLNLSFLNHPHLKVQKFRADEVMSACLFLQVPILAPQKFIEKSRILTAELEDLHQGLLRRPESLRTSHFFLM